MAVLGHPPKRQNNPDDDIFTTLFRTPIHKEPPDGTYAEVDCYIKCLTEIRNLKLVPSKKSNLTPDESTVLINLQKSDHIVIKPADKGGAVVWHIEEAYKQLYNPSNYQKQNKTKKNKKQNKKTHTHSLVGPERHL